MVIFMVSSDMPMLRTNKLLKALNKITFGQFRVWAKVARFDHKPLGVSEKREMEGSSGEGVMQKREVREEVGHLMSEGEKIQREHGEGEKSELSGKDKEEGGRRKEVGEDVRMGKAKVRVAQGLVWE